MLHADIFKIVLDELKNQSINPDVDLSDPNIGRMPFAELTLDSLDLLQFAMRIEEILGVELEIDELPQNASLDEFVAHLVSLKNQ